MKNKIISIIFIILLITSCRKSRDITGDNNGVNNGGNNAGNNGGGNNGNFRFTKDNYEPPQTNTKAAKEFLENFKKMKEKYSKAELMAYYRNIKKFDFTSHSGYKKYYFDSEANITNIYINRSGNKATNCKFWGMLPENPQIACYYYEKNDGKIEVLNSLMYEGKLIEDKISIWHKDGSISRNEGLAKKSRDAVLKSTNTNSTYDNTKLKPSQTNTKEANKWKEQMTNKVLNGQTPYYKQANFYFDNIGNLTIKYTNNTTEINDKYTFWGATNCNGDLYGLYYISNNLNMYYEVIDISTNCKYNENSFSTKNFIFQEGKEYKYDYTGTNTSTNTEANNNWKSKVANKIIEEKEVENTYTFLDNGDISVRTRDNKTYILKFWGATNDYNNYLCGIYYIKLNLRDIFGDIAPNESTYFYYGYRFDENTGYSSYLPELKEFWQDRYYLNYFIKWYELYFYPNGRPKRTINWASMIIQESRYIEFGNARETMLLFEK